MNEQNLGWALHTTVRIADATAQSLGGTWAANLAPLIAATATPLITGPGATRLTDAFRVRCTGQHPAAAQLRFHYEELAFALRGYPAVAPWRILRESQKLLEQAAQLIDVVVSDPAGMPGSRDLRTLRDAFATLAQLRPHTAAEADAILDLRARQLEDPADRHTADQLFDLESR